nr:helix-turn-helix domain-containing protein [Burkholderia sp. HI2714]
MHDIDPMALFRLSVLGPIVSRERLERGELLQLLRQLARQEYAIPGTRRRHISERTLQTWYYAWRRDGVSGLASRPRADTGRSKLPESVQAAVLAAKRENPQRSVRQIRCCSKPPASWRAVRSRAAPYTACSRQTVFLISPAPPSCATRSAASWPSMPAPSGMAM